MLLNLNFDHQNTDAFYKYVCGIEHNSKKNIITFNFVVVPILFNMDLEK